MISAPVHEKEALRLQELLRFDILDSEDEASFDDLTELASHICDSPISLISLIDEKRQWFKSRVGLDAHETPRELAFCAHAILQDNVFEVSNALEDERFVDNPLVTGSPDIRSYAGAPLVTEKGLAIGTLCVIDTKPKILLADQKRALEILAKQVMSQLELRVNYKKLQRIDQEREKIFSVIGHDLRSPFTGILGLSRRLFEKADVLEKEKIKVLASGILSSSLQVFQVLDELMEWTQQRLGRIQSTPQVCELHEVTQQTIALLGDAIMLKGIHCQNDISADIRVLADNAIVKMIIRNLLANAIKYSPEKGSIRFQAIRQEQEIFVSIEDQGQGIPNTLLNQLFKGSVQSTQDSQGQAGSGIGLSLCGELITTQNGRIWVDETYTQGARVCFSLPSAT